MTLPRILLFGANGQVGWELRRILSPLGQVIATTRDGRVGPSLDLSKLMDVRSALDEYRPDIIVNAAAYTAVDRAEQESEQAHRLNAELPALLAEWSSRHQVPVLHFSTDYVFDGAKDSPYSEDDVPNPISVYGRSKLTGDASLLETAWAPFIFRVSWVYAARGSNFLLTMMRLMRERDVLRVVDDQWGAPTWSRDIAQGCGYVVYQALRDREFVERASGLYHLAPAGETSWFGFAETIREKAGLSCRLEAIPGSAYPTPAQRPANSRMNSDRLYRQMGLRLPHWRDSVAACMEELTSG